MPPQVMGDAPNSSLLNDAVEMAVMTSVAHPNIVQLFTCMPNMAEVYDSGEGGGGGARGRLGRATPRLAAPLFGRKRLGLSLPPSPLLVGPHTLAILRAPHLRQPCPDAPHPCRPPTPNKCAAACSSASLCSPTRPLIPDAPPEPPLPSFRRVKLGESGVPTFNVLVMVGPRQPRKRNCAHMRVWLRFVHQ
jgi:hypothetical protein